MNEQTQPLAQSAAQNADASDSFHETELIKALNNAYYCGQERAILIANAQKFVPQTHNTTTENQQIEETNKICAKRFQVLKETMQEKYNHQEILEMLQSQPCFFFKRGWCIPTNNAVRLLTYRNNGTAWLGYANVWEFLLPDEFWQNADNITAFYHAAEIYWNSALSNHGLTLSRLPEQELDRKIRQVLGFQIATTRKRNEYANFLTHKMQNIEKQYQLGKQSDVLHNYMKDFMHLDEEKRKISKLKRFTCQGFDQLFAAKRKAAEACDEQEKKQDTANLEL